MAPPINVHCMSIMTAHSSVRARSPLAFSSWIQLALVFFTAGSVTAADPRRIQDELNAGANHNLVLNRLALGKDFLLSASLIPQATVATSHGLAGLVVRFELFHDGLDLYEAVDGIVVTQDLPSRRLIATFPILEQDATKVVFDFNRGMRRVFDQSWLSADVSGRDVALEVPQGRVFSVERQDSQLVVRQSVQVRDRELDANRESRYEVRYFLTPYQPSDKPGREQSEEEARYARFFATPPLLEPTTGRSTSKMARFDLTKPIQFYYSANTPKEYVEAVKDGILYWNRAFGTNVVRVDKAPDGVTAPDATRNIVQWVPWDRAGVAYADLLLDPRTGESRHGQAYMTSVFAVSGKARARQALRAMQELAAKKDGEKKEKIRPGSAEERLKFGVALLGSASACDVDLAEFAEQYAQGLTDLLANEALTDEAVLRASQDYVREVVAHEVGHVLGLRHNFAGSLSASLSPKELDEWFKAYVVNKGTEPYTNRITTTSMMEYSVFRAAAFVGWRMRVNPEPLPHDRATIQWGYFSGKEPAEKKLLFATDGDAMRYGDVATFDYGADPVLAAYSDLSDLLHNLPNSLIERFIAQKAPRDPRDAVPVSKVPLDARTYAINAAAQVSRMLVWFRSGMRSLKVENDFEVVDELNHKERIKAHWKALNDQVDRLGGLDRAVFAFLPLDLKLELKDDPKGVLAVEKVNATALNARLEKLLESPAYTNWVGLDEKRYSFTPAEKEVILKRGKQFFSEFEKELVKQVCSRLETLPRDLSIEATGTLGEDDLVARLERRIIELARTVILAKDEETHIRGKVDKSLVEVVAFKYDDDTRLAAAKALNDKTGSFRGWSIDAKGDLNKALKDDVEGALNIANFKEFRDSTLSRPLRDWYLKQQDILALLPPKPPGR